MKKQIIRYVKHILGTLLVLLLIGIVTLISLNGSFEYGNNPLAVNLDKEGPYVFYETDSTFSVNYIRGNKTEGFYLDQEAYSTKEAIAASCFFPLDATTFNFTLKSGFKVPKSVYKDNEPIFAISDIESGYKTFRDFLIQNKVINRQLDWTFDKGHLVLVGDFVDRGFSTTQVLWFIYKLEQEAQKQGGQVHFIIGNHELYNMQGKYQSASYKYYGVASILGKQHHDLYDQNSFIGRWMASKNTLELINGNLFAHGGIHPDIANHDITIDQVNQINRDNYHHSYFPKPKATAAQLILSNKKGICWYRGYFNDDISQEEVEKGIHKFNADAIVVGHTLQRKVKKLYDGKVFAIDVKHPKDYNSNWPTKKSEGLLIKEKKYFRIKANGEKTAL
ncbi:metallophosphoesterase [Maribacter polysiphoniae]|uniref:Calcineurin-like phosphoesterase family protein n=1 Tax=Maribacter polysiphoniae TaxID=429344 RepID=A0A316EDZ9_9FLAO|nr:metallophosphoesterase [Maribacter polysiphoniae]MBD1262599.1 metallophosphoesterase [Maribacter polysiphoniae]PWK21200.1 calcineurin-like phosphoesterase family protein [Maribacter polysiphoniae]